MNSCMVETLNSEQIALLKKCHKTGKNKDVSDRIKVVILKNNGWPEEKIAEAFLIHVDTVKRHLKDYHDSERKKLKSENGGSASKLNEAERFELLKHLEEHTYTKAKDICEYVKVTHSISYTVPGMISWLFANAFSYKKPKQKAFIEFYKNLTVILATLCSLGSNRYSKLTFRTIFKTKAYSYKGYKGFSAEVSENLKRTAKEEETILFEDSVYPTMATKVSYGWVKKVSDKAIETLASRTRMNITGAHRFKYYECYYK